MTKGEGRRVPLLYPGYGRPQISPLRCAPVEMTKGEGRRDPLLYPGYGRPQISPLRCAPVEMTKGEGRRVPLLYPGYGRPQISPLRCAPVEMTKGGGASCSFAVSRVRTTTDLSTALRSGRDDKGGRVVVFLCCIQGTDDHRSLHCAALRSR